MGDEATGSPTNPRGTIGSRAVGNAAMLLVARVASRAIALVTVFATANELLPARNGEFQTTVTYTALISILVDLGFNTLYTREGAKHPGEIPRYLRSVLSTRALFAVPALAALAVTMYLSGFQTLLIPAFVVMMLSAYSNVLRSTFYALGTLTFEAYAILAESVVLLGGTLIGVLTHRGVDFFLWCYAVSYGFSCTYFVVVLTVRRMVAWRWEFELRFLREWLPKSLPFALAFVITTLYFKIDQPILLHFRGLTEVGWYAFAYKPIEALLFIPITLLNVAFPVLAVYHQESRERLLRATASFYRALLALGWPISVGTVLLAPGINGLFDRSAGSQFAPAAVALQILGGATFLMFITNAFIAALNAMNRQLLFTWAATVSLVVNVALNLFLIPAYGYQGASWATDLTELALLVVGWLMVRRVLGVVPIGRLSWRILLAGAVMGAVLYPFRATHGWPVLLAILVGMVVYGAGLLLFRAVEPEEFALARRAILRRRG
ncbi:MAG TPA: flippase [Candidatus Dormibacteraeota bacterium]|nr:flippase [Candidatus Dormibacteraeota bacterium]